jgi:ribulose-phosphate 3-epimerase
LAADLGHLADEVGRAASSGADALHLDIMDPTFVPNMSFGPSIVDFCRKISPGFFRHVHLMMRRPDLYLETFAKAGAQTIQIHIEADCDVHHELRRIRELGARAGLVLNPETPVERLLPYLDEVDEILVMTVHPGHGGQKFISDCLPKVEWLSARRPSLDIMVDGGINAETAVLAAKAGANMFVAGSYLFAQKDMAAAVQDMKGRLQ